MRKTILGIAVAASALAAPAMASAPIALDQLLPGSEVRRSIRFGGELRDDVLKLNPDGTVTGNWQVTRGISRHGGTHLSQGRIHGTWTLVKGTLCIQGTGLPYKYASCYAVSKTFGSKREYAATNVRTGDVWKMFIYSPNVL
ncbi:MAG: hypothetical protein ACTSUD_11010 [Alphaproteobacteria bacterium]